MKSVHLITESHSSPFCCREIAGNEKKLKTPTPRCSIIKYPERHLTKLTQTIQEFLSFHNIFPETKRAAKQKRLTLTDSWIAERRQAVVLSEFAACRLLKCLQYARKRIR